MLNSIEVFISRAVIDSYISNDEFGSVSNTLRAYDDMKELIKNLKTSTDHQRFFFFNFFFVFLNKHTHKKKTNFTWSYNYKLYQLESLR